MTLGARVLKNTVILTSLKLAGPAFSIILVFVLSRALGAEGLGRYTLALAYLGIFLTLTPLGLNALVIRDGARDPDALPSLLGHACVLGAASASVCVPVMSALGFVLGYDATTCWAIAIVSAAIFPATLQVLFDAAFMARERAEYIAVSMLVDLAVRVGIGSLVLLLGYGIVGVSAALAGGQVLACLTSLRLLSKLGVRIRWAADARLFRRLLKSAPTFLLISVFATLYWRIDVIMVSALRGISDVGIYGAAYRILEVAKLLPQNICLALFPSLSSAGPVDPEQIGRLGQSVFRYLWMITLPLAIGTTVLAEPLLSFLLGAAFAPAASTLIVLIWTIIPYCWVRYYAYVMVAANRQSVDLWLNVALSAVNVALNLVLIPRYGPCGAAIATFVAVCAFAACQYVYIRRHLPGCLPAAPPLSRPVAASAVMALLVYACRSMPVLLVVAMAAASYFVLLAMLRFFAPEELRFLSLQRLRFLHR